MPTDDALAMIAEYFTQITALKEEDARIRKGLSIFKIDQPPNKEMEKLDILFCILILATFRLNTISHLQANEDD